MSPSFIKRVFSRAKYKYHPSPYGKIKKIQFVLKLHKAHFQIHPYQPMPLHLDHRLLCCGDDRGRANAFYKQVKRFVPALYIVVLFLIRSYNATLCSDIHIRSGRLSSYWHCITLSSQHKLALTIPRGIDTSTSPKFIHIVFRCIHFGCYLLYPPYMKSITHRVISISLKWERTWSGISQFSDMPSHHLIYDFSAINN